MRKLINSAFVSLDGVTADPSSWAIFALVRRNELSDAVAKTTIREPQPALAGTN